MNNIEGSQKVAFNIINKGNQYLIDTELFLILNAFYIVLFSAG
ncbi:MULTISPECIES: hypothetical protein [unclassified Psychrobacter]|nr:hypothetical protein [Psychrobacter sp. G]AGP48102.1 hypothetical protein PSYCG_02690 [Psychrobacter sp. G]